MSRIENTGQIKPGYSVKAATNSEEKVGNGSDFASMLTKYKKNAGEPMLPPGLEPRRKAFRKGLDLLPRPDAGRRKMEYKKGGNSL